MKFPIRSVSRFLLVFLFALTGYFYAHAYLYADVNNDAGFYLGMAQQILSGNRLYVDILNVYAPFAFYYFALIMALFGQGYKVILLFQYLIIFSGALVLFSCLQQLYKDKTLNLILSLLFLLSNYFYHATFIYLEPFVNLFGLLAIFCLLKTNVAKNRNLYLLAGLFASLSFLSKQFGIIYLAFGGLFLVTETWNSPNYFIKDLVKKFLPFLLGVSIPFLIFLIYYFAIGVRPGNLIISRVSSAYPDESLVKYFGSVKVFFQQHYLVFLFIPLALFLKIPAYPKRLLLLFLALFLMLTSVFYVKGFAHYYMLILPGSFLVLGATCSCLKTYRIPLFTNLFVISVWLYALVITFKAFAFLQFRSNLWNREDQLKAAREINRLYPPSSRVQVLEDYYFYYLCELVPFSPKNYGYIFLSAITKTQTEEVLNEAKVYLLNKGSKDKFLSGRNVVITEVPGTELIIAEKQEKAEFKK